MNKSFKDILLATVLAAGAGFVNTAMAAIDVTIAVPHTFTDMDPYNNNSTQALSVDRGWYEGLFTFDKDMKIVPLLATGYQVSDDGLRYTVELRQGIKFQDGTPFNAEAVKVTFDRAKDPANALARYTMFKNLSEVKVLSPEKVVFILKTPDSSFINTLAHPTSMIISPEAIKKWGKLLGQHPSGTGPFEFVSWSPADGVKMKKWDGYWDKEHMAKVDSIYFRVIKDANTRASVIQTGEAQFAPISVEQISQLKADSRVEIVASPSILARGVALNNHFKPFNNELVRQAMNYAINKEALIKVAFKGYAKPLHSPLPATLQYATDVGYYPYNPVKAKELLKEAGYPNGFSFPLTSMFGDSQSAKIMQFIQQQLLQVGIKANIIMLDQASASAKVAKVKNPDEATVRAIYYGWSASTGDANWALYPLFDSESWPPNSYNLAYYKNDKVDADLKAALLTTDNQKKAQLYKGVQEILFKEAPWIFLVSPQNLSAQSKNLKGFDVLPDGSYQFRDISYTK